jgi:hypothetical protein
MGEGLGRSLEVGGQMKWGLVASLVITLLAIVSVFVEIPIVSNYSFWVLFSSWLLVVARK